MELQQRAPTTFFAALSPPPGLEMYYGNTTVPRLDQMAVDPAAVVPYAPAASRKRSAPDDWTPVEQPSRGFRSHYDDGTAHMDDIFDQVRRRVWLRCGQPLI